MRLPELEQRAIYRILNFSLRAGNIMLASGAGTIEVESTILKLAESCGLSHCEVDVTFTSMTASHIRSDDVEPITTLQVVRHRNVDYSCLASVYAVREDLADQLITPEEAFGRIDAIAASRTRRKPFEALSWSGMAAAFTVLLGGREQVAAVAFVSSMTILLVSRPLARRGIPDFFLVALGSAVATAFAMALVAIHVHAQASLVVAGGIMILVPGYALVASVQDALTGFPISGSARGLEVMLTALGIITGVAAVLYATVRMGISASLRPVAHTPLAHFPIQVAAAGVAVMLYGAATSVPRRCLPMAGGVGALGWGTFLLLRQAAITLIPATAVAAVLVGAAGNVLARRQQTHPFLYVVPGMMPLVPGLTLYQGMLDLASGQQGPGSVTVLRALAMGLAIAAGVTLGNMIIRPLRRPASTRTWSRKP